MRLASCHALLRPALVGLLSVALILAPTLPAAAATTATTSAPKLIGDLKTGQQFRAEAASYDQAVKAINSISLMRLTTQTELTSAIAVLRRHAPNLKLLTSKLVTIGYEDRAYTTAIARNFANERMAQDFARKLTADYKSVMQLDGARALQKRMGDLVNANGAMIQKAAESLRMASLRLTGKTGGVQPQYLPTLEPSAWYVLTVLVLAAIAFTFPPLVIGLAVYGLIFAPAAVAVFAASPVTAFLLFSIGLIFASEYDSDQGSSSEPTSSADSEAIARCVEGAIARNEQCLANVSSLPASERLTAQLACASTLAAEQAYCSLAGAFY